MTLTDSLSVWSEFAVVIGAWLAAQGDSQVIGVRFTAHDGRVHELEVVDGSPNTLITRRLRAAWAVRADPARC
jgi:hypothetical protein